MRKALAIAGLIAALSFSLFHAYELKRPCLQRPWGAPEMLEYRNLCYNDIQALYHARKLNERAFPYVVEKSYEYPVLMGLSMWGTSWVASNHQEYFKASVVVLALFAMVSLLCLTAAMGARRELLWFSLGTPILFYSFLNWDLLPVMLICLSIFAWSRGKVALSGAMIGLGVAAKIYPGFLLPSLAIAAWQKGKTRETRMRGVRALVLSALTAWLAVNLPVMLAEYFSSGSIQGWLAVFRFHAKREADFGTIWFWLVQFVMETTPSYLSVLPTFVSGAFAIVYISKKDLGARRIPFVIAYGGMALVAGIIMQSFHVGTTSAEFRTNVDWASQLTFMMGAMGLWFAQWKRHHSPWATGAGVLALYLVVSKIHSPQHALWIYPLMVLINVRPSTLIGYLVGDACVFLGGFSWFATANHMYFNAWQAVFGIGVLTRAAFLLHFSAQCAAGAKDRLILAGDSSQAGDTMNSASVVSNAENNAA
jgi:hypothetical protein